jgi:hypothetical protein
VPQPAAEVFFGLWTRVIEIEVDYVRGASPYSGELNINADVWSVFSTNVLRLFRGGEKTLVLPNEISQMEDIGDVGAKIFDRALILELARAHRDLITEPGRATYYLLFLPGIYHDGKEERPDLLGVSIGDTGVIALFKDSIKNASAEALPQLVALAEQIVLTHEFSHAIGLVNRGVTLTSAHHDAEHGAHCQNPDCLMFYAAEQLGQVSELAQKTRLTGDINLYGAECLRDVELLTARLK